jgi:hypothetical protein
MKSYDFAKTAIVGLPLLRESVDRRWFLRFLEDWKYRRDGFSHRYKSENVVSLLCFVEIAQAFRDEV